MPEYFDYLDSRPELPGPIADADSVSVSRGGVVYKSDALLQDIFYRLSVLEGTVPAPTPAPGPAPAAAPTAFAFDLAASSTGVTVVRAGTAGTYIDAAGVLIEAAANVLRPQHEAGVRLGVYCEKARTNFIPWGRFPGAGTGWIDAGTTIATFTLGYTLGGATPDGDVDGATRFAMAVATGGYDGKRRPVTGLAGTQEIHKLCYVKSLLADSLLAGHPGGWVEPSLAGWTLYETMQAPTANFDVDLIGSWTPTDDIVWALYAAEGGALGESMILTNGAAVTRPKEVITCTGLSAATYDVTVTYAGGAEQVFAGEVVAGTTWALDADDVTAGQNIVAAIDFYAVGTAPSPAPTPPPIPPASAPPGAVWTPDMMALAVAQSYGSNEFTLQGMNGNTSGWRGNSSMGMGRRWQNQDPKWYDWFESSVFAESLFYEWVDPWFILTNEEGSSGNGYIDLKRFDFQYRLIGATSWIRPVPMSDTVRWCNDYGIDGSQNFTGSSVNTERRAGLDGGVSVKVNQNKYPHGGPGLGLIHIPGCHTGATNNIAAVMVRVMFRKDPRSDASWKGGMHVSFDPKPNGTGYQGDLPWYINGNTSITAQATSSWRQLNATCVWPESEGSQDPTRTMTATQFYAYPPLL